MKLLNNMTIKNLKLNKKRTLVTIIGIVLSVALMTAVASLFMSFRETLISYEINLKGNYHYEFANVPASDLKYFEKNRMIEDNSIVKNIGYAKLDNIKNKYKPYLYIKAYNDTALKNLAVNLTEGRVPQNSNEIVIPTHLETNGRVKYNVGDKITLNVGTRENDGTSLDQYNPYDPEDTDTNEKLVNVSTREYTIVGIMQRPSRNIEPYSAPGYTVITYLDNFDTGYYDVYSLYTKKGLNNKYQVSAGIVGVSTETFRKYVEGTWDTEEEATKVIDEMHNVKYDLEVNSYLISLETGLFKESSTRSMGMVIGIVLIIIVVSSVFCIRNSFDISISERVRQYGMLRSVGATSKQIKHNVYYEAFILFLIGVPLGIICGILASYILIIISNIFLGSMLTLNLVYKFSWLSILFASVLGFTTVMLSAHRSAKKSGKIIPIEALKNSAEVINKKRIRTPKIINKLFGIGGVISYKNIKRNRKKYRPTVIAIIVCVSVFIGLSAFLNIVFDSIDMEVKTMDYNLSLSYLKNSISKSKLDTILSSEDVIDYGFIDSMPAEISLDNVKLTKEYLDINNYYEGEDTKNVYASIFYVGEHAFKNYLKSLGLSNISDNAAIVVNIVKEYIQQGNKSIPTMVDVLDVKENTNLKLSVDNKEYNLEVAKVTDKLPFGISEKSCVLLVVSDNAASKIEYHNPNTRAMLKINSKNPKKLQDKIDEVLKDDDYDLYNYEENAKTMNSIFTLMAIFLYGFITVISLIGITSIFNTITTSMNLRKREFACLRSIGMTNHEFNRMVSLESIFYGVKALLIGIPIGILLSYLIYKTFNSGGSMYIAYSIPIKEILIASICVFILLLVIMRYSISKINEQNIIETIRKENI